MATTMTNRPAYVPELPNELFGEVASHLDDGKDIKCFRLASQTLAEAGRRPLRDWISDTIQWPLSAPFYQRNPAEFVHGVVKEVGSSPNVTTISIFQECGPHAAFPRSFADINLPSLDTLELAGMAVSAYALKNFLSNHKRTLRHAVIADVALISTKTTDPERKREWATIVKYMRDYMDLESIEMHHLTWYNPNSEMLVGGYVHLPHAKYHRRVYRDADSERIYSFQPLREGVKSDGMVAVALNVLLSQALEEGRGTR